MCDWPAFAALLARFAKVQAVQPTDVLFRSGLDIPSIAFTEFIMELEDMTSAEIDLDGLDASIVTAGQLHARLFAL